MLLVLGLATAVAAAPVDDPAPADPAADSGLVVVRTRRPVDAPCRVLLDREGQRELPVRGTMGLLDAVPGLVLTSRLGLGGPRLTAYRGLVTPGGSQIAVELEGVPLNEPGHILSPGLVDLSPVPRPLVEAVDWCPGATAASAGPFALAGRASFRLARPHPGWWAEIGGGTDGAGRIAVQWGPPGRDAGTFVHAEIDGGQGVGDDRTWRHLRLAAGLTGSLDAVDLAVFLLTYDARDDVAPFLREDDLLDGRVRFYGSTRDWTGTMVSRRALVGTRLVHVAPWGGVRAVAWGGLRGWRLSDNLTGFLRDPIDGDGLQSRHAGQDAGVRLHATRNWRVLGDVSRLEGGGALQGAFARQRVHPVDLVDTRRGTDVDRTVGTVSLSGWARGTLGLFEVARVSAGVRVEQVEIRARDRLEAPGQPARSGALLLRPDAQLVLTPHPTVQLQASWGRGGEPPDPRDLDTAVLPRPFLLDVVDARLTARPVEWMAFGLDGFVMFGKDERVRDPILDLSLFTASTRRTGGALSAEVAPPGLPADLPLTLGADIAFADARRTDTGALLPYAPRWSGNVTAAIRRWDLSTRRARSLYLHLGVRFGWVGRLALPDGFTARGFSSADIRIALDWRRWTFTGEVDNAVPWRWRQIEAFTPSRWDLDAAPTDLPVRHLIAGRPFALRLAVSRRF